MEFQDNMLQITEADIGDPTTASLNLEFLSTNKFCIVINYSDFQLYRRGSEDVQEFADVDGNDIRIYVNDFYIRRKYTRSNKTSENSYLENEDLHFYVNKSTGNFKVKVDHTGKNITDYFEKVKESSFNERLVLSNKRDVIYSNSVSWVDPVKINNVKIYKY